MRLRKRTKIENSNESTFELDLAPMLALMVTLIPIMLLSTVFVRVTVIDTALPQLVQNALDEDRSKKDREVNVVLKMKNSQEFLLQVKVDGRVVSNSKMPKSGDSWDYSGLHKALVGVKVQHPKVFRLDLTPDKGVKYSDIVKVMDEARKIKDENRKVFIMDKATNKKVATDLMFPDVIFANVVEG